MIGMIHLTWWHLYGPKTSFWLLIWPTTVFFLAKSKVLITIEDSPALDVEHGQVKSHECHDRAASCGSCSFLWRISYVHISLRFSFDDVSFFRYDLCFFWLNSFWFSWYFLHSITCHLEFRSVNIDPGFWRCMVLGCRYCRGANWGWRHGSLSYAIQRVSGTWLPWLKSKMPKMPQNLLVHIQYLHVFAKS